MSAYMSLPRLASLSLLLITLIASLSPQPTEAQSGRKQTSSSQKEGQRPKQPTPSKEGGLSGPIVEPPRQTSTRPAGKQGQANDSDDEDVVRISSNLVPIPASVSDENGKAVSNLELKDFELMVDGEPRTIGDLSRAETPVRMAVLFDNSSSLTAAREFQKHAAVRFFRKVLRPVDQAALFSISTDATLVYPLTENVNALAGAIENFGKPEGATSMFDTLALAADYLRPHQGRKVIVIISDGVDTSSRLDFNATLRIALAADCQIYAVQTGHSDNTNLRDLTAERRLQEFAAQTGGAVFTPKANAELDRAFAQIAADLAQQYILSYYPSNERRDGRFHTLTLRVASRPNLRVRTRKGYYAPKG